MSLAVIALTTQVSTSSASICNVSLIEEYGIRPDSLEARSTIDINLIFAMHSSCTRPTPHWKATSTLKG
ncbi:hypothetical protein HanXRQr2_Chr17g0796841 [Helianthus annuus]|uniref:Uncharacterized protein n=1 Tax=Helianthus annuus TaxID=4232 RepID=A0A9K3DIM8_HELAN|nr:hypothetical protein HanXRQr2_Chr17g0796841 [Helianthus annuus]KAJ0812675.1 hypothetical protein HanPSC8_Chr17g0764601 [Helianthus annuus]